MKVARGENKKGNKKINIKSQHYIVGWKKVQRKTVGKNPDSPSYFFDVNYLRKVSEPLKSWSYRIGDFSKIN